MIAANLASVFYRQEELQNHKNWTSVFLYILLCHSRFFKAKYRRTSHVFEALRHLSKPIIIYAAADICIVVYIFYDFTPLSG
jgi:hypothetical protein